MKAFLVCTALFLLLALLVTQCALSMGKRIEKLQDLSKEAAKSTLEGDVDHAHIAFRTLKKEWNRMHIPLLLIIHHSTLKPIDRAITDAESAFVLAKNDRLYEALARLSHELGSLSDDLMRPAL